MAHWLPFHLDRHYLNQAAAVWGQYKLQFKAEISDPDTVRATANRELDAFSRRADRAMEQYQANKAARRR